MQRGAQTPESDWVQILAWLRIGYVEAFHASGAPNSSGGFKELNNVKRALFITHSALDADSYSIIYLLLSSRQVIFKICYYSSFVLHGNTREVTGCVLLTLQNKPYDY